MTKTQYHNSKKYLLIFFMQAVNESRIASLSLTSESLSRLNDLQNGRYVLKDCLSQNNHESSYRGLDTNSDQRVIIRAFPQNIQNKELKLELEQRFVNFSRIVATCNHPHLVKLEDSFVEDGTFYWVYPEFQGQSLSELLENKENLNQEQAIKYLRQIASGIEVLHDAGLVHNDIRPQNILIDLAQDRAIITNLDLIGQLKVAKSNFIKSGYTAPEQEQNPNLLNPTTDIYSLTATVYYIVTGNVLIPVSLQRELNWLQRYQLSPDLCGQTQLLLERGLELDAQKRPQSIKEWLSLSSNLHSEQSLTRNQPVTAKSTGNKNPVVNSGKQASVRKQSVKLEQSNQKSSNYGKFGLGKFLLLTSAIAITGGIGFGSALRFTHPNEAGATLFHSEQSFPAREQWPISTDSDLERKDTQNPVYQ